MDLISKHRDLDDFVNRIGTVPNCTTNIFYMYNGLSLCFSFDNNWNWWRSKQPKSYQWNMSSTTISIYHDSPSYQTQYLPTNRSGVMPFGGPTEPCCTSTTVVLGHTGVDENSTWPQRRPALYYSDGCIYIIYIYIYIYHPSCGSVACRVPIYTLR
jgi:hypothetical protein